MKLTTKEFETLVAGPKERVESFFWGPQSDWIAFTSNRRNGVDFDLYKMDLSSKKETLLAEMQGLNSITDISSNGQLIALTQYRSVTDSDVLVFDLKKNKMTNVTSSLGKTSSKQGVFTANSSSLLFISDYKTERGQLQLIDLKENSTPHLLTRESGEIEDFKLDNSRRSLIYMTNQDGYGIFSGSELLSNGLFQKPFSVPRNRDAVMGSPSFVREGTDKQFFFSETSTSQPTGVWLWRGGKKIPWTQTAKSLIDNRCFASETLIKYPSFDGRQIPAFLFLPNDYAVNKRPIPFVIYSHGGPESQYRPAFSKIFQYFLQRGFGILAPNVRGSTGYGKTYVSLDDYKKRMDSVKDTLEGAKWLISQGYTLPNQLGIFGGSYGGFMVLRSIQEGRDLFAAASESVGITDFITFLKNTKPYRRPLREVEYGPLSDEQFLNSVSPMNYLNKIKTPLLVFHGANDPRVPVSETEQLVKTLKEKNIPVELKIFPDEGHGNTKLRNILEQARLMVHFFENQFEKGK
ncbi:MAG: S9 family peptidase [Proteobacteria bacterium]|nr:S9 family peptidase [Pseudomonadota bacterium]